MKWMDQCDGLAEIIPSLSTFFLQFYIFYSEQKRKPQHADYKRNVFDFI